MNLFADPQLFIIFTLSLASAITVHEFAHAFAADHLGDPTPRLQGRLSLNPLVHLDPFGTLMLFLVGFGWGRPVVFDPFNLRNPKRDSAIISLAGPTANIILAILASIVLRFIFGPLLISKFLEILIYLNILLAVFNLIPVHPLDGFKIVEGALSHENAIKWGKLERYGLILMAFLILPLFGKPPIHQILNPVLDFLLPIFLPQKLV